ncbi:MAG: MucBP domain-containing protein [Clostridia bacterium]|nr:MucBP domain-containing protein [Clostridia bacterium]
MKKRRIIALLTAVVMIMSVVPAMASVRSVGGYFVDADGDVYEKSGANLISNPGFEEGLTGLTDNAEYYEVSSEEVHSGSSSLKAIKSTKGDGAITKYVAVEDANASYYLSFWYKNTDESAARRPRVTFAFTDSSKTIPTVEDDFTDETNAWIQAGTQSNDQDMEYSKGEWVQYTTVLKGNGNADACANVVLNIYGLTKNVAYVDDFELYELVPSEEYDEDFRNAVENWEKNVSLPKGNLEGFGTLELSTDTGVDGVSVRWESTHVDIVDPATGAYSAPAEETLVILSAVVYIENTDISYTFEYPYIVKSMFTPYVEWMNNVVFKELGSSIKGNVHLVKSHSIKGYYPATITWECSDENVLDGDGNFTAPETTKNIDLVATIECNGETTTVTKRMKAIGGNIVNDGLIMYYDFEKTAKNTVYDNSQKSIVYDATSSGVTYVDGFAQFAGGDSVIKLPLNYAQELTGSYSVSMWVKPDESIATNAALFRFFDFGGGTTNSQFLAYVPSSGQLSFMDRGTSGSISKWALLTNVDGLIDTWTLLSLVYDFTNKPATAKLYVNGELVATSDNDTLTKSVFEQVGASSDQGYIGRTQWMNADNPDFVGFMDDVRIYNRAITASEALTLYNETRPTVTAPVTIKFQDIEGNTLKDDVTVSVDVGINYDVPSNYKTLPSFTEDQYRYAYKYIASKSLDSITVSADGENVCILVFQMEKLSLSSNIIENGSFENGVTGWTTSNYGKQIAIGSDGFNLVSTATDGDKALQLTAANGSGSAGALSTRWPVQPDTVYTFSFDIMHDPADKVTTGFLEMMDATGANLGHIAGDNPGHLWSGSGEYVPTKAGEWVRVEYVFTTTSATTQLGFKLAWIGADKPATVDNFSLTAYTDNPSEDETDKIEITIKYVDTEGNTIREDEKDYVTSGTQSYTVPDRLKTVDDLTQGNLIYKYTYNAKATDGGDVVPVSILRENVAVLVFDSIKADKNSNLVVDGGFKDEEGNFSWGTWQSPQTSEYFENTCQDWFYQVNRDTNASALYLTGLTANDYALGTRWNDGTAGLCSMANFIPVKKGKTYLVSYDYKHQTAGTDGSFISTSFVTSKNTNAGSPSGSNIPKNVSTSWQTNTFTITAPSDGYIYFHFSWLGSGGANGGNAGSGPYWYFDNFEVLEVIAFENKITYANGYAEIVAEDGTEGYLVQATYDNEGALTSFTKSEKLTLSQEKVTKVPVQAGAKLMLVKNFESLEPIAPAIIAE